MGTIVQESPRITVQDQAKAHRPFMSVRALGKNLSAWSGRGGRRPSIWLGMKLLLKGEWGTFKRQLIVNSKPVESPLTEYQKWLRNNAITPERRDLMDGKINSWTVRPKISIILPISSVTENNLRACLDSVVKQIYPDWQLCAAVDAPPTPHVRKVLEEYSRRDARICVRYLQSNGGISAACNSALEIAGGEYIALLGPEDELAEHALFRVAEAIVGDASVDMIYSDEDKLSAQGERIDPFFKPDWSPEYFLSCMYTCHLGVYRTELVRQAGAWRSEFDGAQHYDLVPRLLAKEPKIRHVSDVLYHWRVGTQITAIQAYKKVSQDIQTLRPSKNPTGSQPPRPDRHISSPSGAVDVIIPVYRGLEETRRCIESVLHARALNTAPHEVVVIDDASPDPTLREYLRELAKQKKISLIVNERTLGFVASVNKGMSLHESADVLLLNSDTQVANDWLDRLRSAAYSGEKIATVTPFSNSATLCSFPRPHENNSLPADWSMEEVDRIFKAANSGKSIELPTAVGFCMYIRRQTLRELGLFDAEAYGKGYGEENDFCMKASQRGWRHVLAADTFVYHAGETSFEQSDVKKARALATLTKRYPAYEQLIRSHVLHDPAADCRMATSIAMLKKSGRPVLLAMSHNLGGGTEKHLRDLAELGRDKVHTLVLRPVAPRRVRVESLDASVPLRVEFDPFTQRQQLVNFILAIGTSRMHVHHIWEGEMFLPALLDILHRQYGIPYDLTLHDYFFLAPNPHLIDSQGVFIGEPEEKSREIMRHGKSKLPLPATIEQWRERHKPLLSGAQRIISPCHDAARRFERGYPDLKFTVAAHPRLQVFNVSARLRQLREREDLRVVILGALGPEKGINVVEAVARRAKERGVRMRFRVIGPTSHAPDPALVNLSVHGPYKQTELPGLLEEFGAHLAWFPAQCPETFCYTLSEAMDAGLPIVCSDLGALPERLAGRPWSWSGAWNQSANQWCDLLLRAGEHIRSGQPPAIAARLSDLNEDFYQRDFFSWIR